MDPRKTDTGPKNPKKAAESFVAERAAARRAEQADTEPRSIALEPEEIETTLDLSPTDISRLEEEKRQLQEAMVLPQPSDVATTTSTVKRPAAVAPEAAEDVEDRLKHATDLVREHEEQIAKEQEADRLAAEKRGHELETARQQLGLVEIEKNRLAQKSTIRNLSVITDRFKEGGSENDARGLAGAVEKRKQWAAQATPLLQKTFAFESELKEFLRTHQTTLEYLSTLTWEKVSARYRAQDRTAIVYRSNRPARELLGTVKNVLLAIEEIAGRAEAVIDGRMAPDPTLLARIQNCAKHTIRYYDERLAILSVAIARIEERAKHFESHKPQEVRMRPAPLPPAPGSDVAPIQTGYDIHGPTKQN